MNRTQILNTVFLTLTLVVPLAEAQSREPGAVEAELHSDRVYEGQSFTCSVYVQNLDDAEPHLESLEDFDAEFLGKRVSNNVVITNGTMVRRTTHEYQYRLKPKRNGNLEVPPFVVEHGGKTYASKRQKLTVTPAEAQDTVRLEQSLDRDSVFRAQAFTVTLVVNVKAIENAPARNPVEIARLVRRVRAPHLLVPWLDDDRLPSGLQPESDWESILIPLSKKRGVGFRINRIPADRSLFLDPIDRTFCPDPKRVRLPDAENKPTQYWQYVFSRRLTGVHPGTYRLEPCACQGRFGVAILSSEVTVDDVYARSNAVEVEVRDVPTDGRPANYIGLSGSITSFVGQILPASARVGDPLTLTLRLRGSGTLNEASAPDLSTIPEIAERFKVLEPIAEMVEGERLFTYSLRPLSTEIQEVPSLEVSYFDVESEQFRTVATSPIPLTVAPSEQLRPHQIIATPNSTPESGLDIELAADGIFGNATDIDAFRNDGIRPTRWFIGWGTLISLYGAGWMWMVQRSKKDSAPQRAAPRHARNLAQTHLVAARRCVSQPTGKSGATEIREAIIGFLDGVTGQASAGMTPREVRSKLLDLSVSTTIADQAFDLLTRIDATQYGGERVAPLDVDKAEQVLDELATDLSNRGTP